MHIFLQVHALLLDKTHLLIWYDTLILGRGSTPLHLGIEAGQPVCVSMLLRYAHLTHTPSLAFLSHNDTIPYQHSLKYTTCHNTTYYMMLWSFLEPGPTRSSYEKTDTLRYSWQRKWVNWKEPRCWLTLALMWITLMQSVRLTLPNSLQLHTHNTHNITFYDFHTHNTPLWSP